MDIGGGSWIGWIGILFSIIALWLYATAKGLHGAWSLFGLLSIPGFIIGIMVIYSLTVPEAKRRKCLIWLFGIIGIYLSLFWFVEGGGGLKYLGLVGTILLVIALWLYATAKEP